MIIIITTGKKNQNNKGLTQGLALACVAGAERGGKGGLRKRR